ncbi:hypothetical protein DFH09DRAFT_620184, partial [Mycena vulgaris]
MDDPEKGLKKQTLDVDDDEAAGGKMWAVYVAEAEKYDRGLVESWKSDMEGMLIFAGLFSASLVAFLIESYKTLTPNSGDTTVLLLTQISSQLAAAANGTPFTVVPRPHFTPPTSLLVCNILWFISLGLSLTCALFATLVEQWAREFMHKADMRSAPVIRARVFSYLYYGLKRFKMHTIVGIIPLLLHVSLLFFFAGLVAFLIPVNTVITIVTGIILLIVATGYSLLTILPLVYIDCPYRTPLSGSLWQLAQKIPGIQRHLHGTHRNSAIPGTRHQADTMMELVFDKAMLEDSERLERDKKALVWTMKSLADDTELEPFIEAIPDVLWGPSRRRSLHDNHIQCLIDDQDPHVRLLDRIQDLYRSCDTGLLTSEASTRRKISCYQATWAVGSLTTRDKSCDHALFNHIITNAPTRTAVTDSRVLHHSVSVVAMSRWGSFCAAQDLLQETLTHLTACNAAITTATLGQPNTGTSGHNLLDCLRRLKSYSISLHFPEDLNMLSSHLETLTEEFGNLSTTIPFRILMDYLTEAAFLASPPFRFQSTLKCISPPKSDVPLTKRWLGHLEGRVGKIIDGSLADLNLTNQDCHWIDGIIHSMMSYWVPPETGTRIPQSFLKYLNGRSSEVAVKAAMNSLQIGTRGKRFIPATILRLTKALSDASSDPKGYFYIQRTEQSLSDLWAILCRAGTSLDLPSLEKIINEVSHIDSPLMTPSIVALAKHKGVTTLLGDDAYCKEHGISQSSHPFLPAETATAHLEEAAALKHRQDEGQLEILANFIHECQTSNQALFKARETLEILGAFVPGDISSGVSFIHLKHQLRFARAVESLVEASGNRGHWCSGILDTIPGLPLFTAYAPRVPVPSWGSPYYLPQTQTTPAPSWGTPYYAPQTQTTPAPSWGPPARGLLAQPGWATTPYAQPGMSTAYPSQGPLSQAAQWLKSTSARRILRQTLVKYLSILSEDAPAFSLI